MAPPPVRRTIAGHDYVIALHPATEGLSISLRLSSIAIGMVSDLLEPGADVETLLGALGAGEDADPEADAEALGTLIKLGDAIRAMLADPSAPALVRDLVQFTSRDGQPLHTDAAFNAAYTGNYGELIQVVMAVVGVNGFLPVLGGSEGHDGATQGLHGLTG